MRDRLLANRFFGSAETASRRFNRSTTRQPTDRGHPWIGFADWVPPRVRGTLRSAAGIAWTVEGRLRESSARSIARVGRVGAPSNVENRKRRRWIEPSRFLRWGFLRRPERQLGWASGTQNRASARLDGRNAEPSFSSVRRQSTQNRASARLDGRCAEPELQLG